MSHNPALVSDPHTCISAVSVGPTHLNEFSGVWIVLLIYVQCGAGSGTVACRHFQGLFMASVFLRVSAPRDRMCICNTAHTRHGKCSCQGSPPRHPASASLSRNKLRARSPLPFSQRDFAHAQNHLPEMHASRPGKSEKEGLWGISGAEIRAIHLAA